MTSVADPAMPRGAAREAAAAPAASTRDIRLDFFRGLAMFIILIAHTPNNFFTSWIPARFGFSDATEIFVFCSGMASAIAFGRTFDRAGWRLGAARVGYRVWQVYWAHLGLFFAVATMLAAIDHFGDFDKVYIGTLNLWKFFSDPGPQLVGLFSLTYVPNYFDILPMYLVILVMLPMMVALSRVSVWAVFAAMAVIWLFAQRALLDAVGLMHLHLGFPAEPWSDRKWFFNPFGWQLVFFTGFALMRGWIPKPPVNPMLIGLALALVIANVPLSHIGMREIFGPLAPEMREAVIDWRIANQGLINKSDFGILRYVHFLALAYLCWAAAGDGGARLRAVGSGLAARAWGRLLSMILKVGQQSLAVFVFSMFFARLSGFVMDQVGRTTWSMTLANLAGFAALIALAYAVSWFKAQPWRAAR
ncbi:MAG TPA: OpgC domain-containing protein [Roseovarius sp.]|nr:OpgC domain-containing protein [Roseovarius sp.]